MSVYGFRDNKLVVQSPEIKESIVLSKKNEAKAVTYIKLDSCAASRSPVYLFVGTAGRLCLSSTAPVGTSGVFANIGGSLGTTA
jgi:hypothetical protein